jgi:spore coat protein CotH
MRERLSMALFKHMGLVAEREAHARLYINNTYVGLYTIVESLDKTFLTKNFNENDGHLYEYSFDNAASSPFNFGYPGADASLYAPAPFKPETLELDPQGQVIERLFWTINNAGDAVWRSSMEEFLDLKKFIRHLAIENFLAEEDGLTGDYGPNNLLLPLREHEPLHVPPGDKSNTFLGEPVLLHPPQHRGRHGSQTQPPRGAGAEGPRAAGALAEHDPRVRGFHHAAGGRDAVAAVGGDAHLGSDSRRERLRSVSRGLHERGLGRVNPIPDELGADAQRPGARAGGRGPRQTRSQVVAGR